MIWVGEYRLSDAIEAVFDCNMMTELGFGLEISGVPLVIVIGNPVTWA